MMFLKQSTAVDLPMGPFVDETDGKTAETALTITQPDVRLKKNGGAWAQKSAAQTLSHEENGWYEVALSTTDTDTLGHLVVAIHESGALPVWREFMVVTANVYDSLVGGSDTLDVQVTGLGANVITAASMNADASAEVADAVWDEARTDHVAAGSFGQAMQVIRSSTAQSGTTSTLVLDASASSSDSLYVGCAIAILAGTGEGQIRRCSAYTGSTKTATVSPNWGTAPDSDSVFIIIGQ